MKKRVGDAEVIAAIQAWRGNVTAAANELGLAPINLRKRLTALGIDLTLLRSLKDTGISGIKSHVPASDPAGIQPSGRNKVAARILSGIFPAEAARRSLSGVSTGELPITRSKPSGPIRVHPIQRDQIRRGRRRLALEADLDLDDSALLSEFIEETFEDWLARKLEAVRHARHEAPPLSDTREAEKP